MSKITDFGLTAVGEADIKPGAPQATWNILAIGLFCDLRQRKPSPVRFYVYGLSADRLGSDRPVNVTVTVDGRAYDLVLRPLNDVALAPVEVAFVQSLMWGKQVAVSIKDYNSPNPDRINMDYAVVSIRTALKVCSAL